MDYWEKVNLEANLCDFYEPSNSERAYAVKVFSWNDLEESAEDFDEVGDFYERIPIYNPSEEELQYVRETFDRSVEVSQTNPSSFPVIPSEPITPPAHPIPPVKQIDMTVKNLWKNLSPKQGLARNPVY